MIKNRTSILLIAVFFCVFSACSNSTSKSTTTTSSDSAHVKKDSTARQTDNPAKPGASNSDQY